MSLLPGGISRLSFPFTSIFSVLLPSYFSSYSSPSSKSNGRLRPSVKVSPLDLASSVPHRFHLWISEAPPLPIKPFFFDFGNPRPKTHPLFASALSKSPQFAGSGLTRFGLGLSSSDRPVGQTSHNPPPPPPLLFFFPRKFSAVVVLGSLVTLPESISLSITPLPCFLFYYYRSHVAR